MKQNKTAVPKTKRNVATLAKARLLISVRGFHPHELVQINGPYLLNRTVGFS